MSDQLEIKQYSTVSRFVEAIEVTAENMVAVANWVNCNIVTQEDKPGEGIKIGARSPEELKDAYIQLRVKNAPRARLTKAYVGDYVVRMGKALRVYEAEAFAKSYLEVETLPDAGTPLYDELHTRFVGKMQQARAVQMPEQTLAEQLARMASELAGQQNAPTVKTEPAMAVSYEGMQQARDQAELLPGHEIDPQTGKQVRVYGG